MKKKSVLFIFLFFLFFSLPLLAGEELMTKLFFDKWLYNTTEPLERQIDRLRETFTALEKEVRELQEQMGTEIKVTIDQHTAYIDGYPIQLEAAPVISKGRTMVPVRFIGEALGANFLWEEKTRKVTYIYNDIIIEIFIEQQQSFVNRKPIMLDTAPFIIAGRTMVPLRFISEHLGASVIWDEVTRTVTING